MLEYPKASYIFDVYSEIFQLIKKSDLLCKNVDSVVIIYNLFNLKSSPSGDSIAGLVWNFIKSSSIQYYPHFIDKFTESDYAKKSKSTNRWNRMGND